MFLDGLMAENALGNLSIDWTLYSVCEVNKGVRWTWYLELCEARCYFRTSEVVHRPVMHSWYLWNIKSHAFVNWWYFDHNKPKIVFLLVAAFGILSSLVFRDWGCHLSHPHKPGLVFAPDGRASQVQDTIANWHQLKTESFINRSLCPQSLLLLLLPSLVIG
jgi:hypothetical protein